MAVEVRAQVWAKTDGRCWYCGKLMNPWNDFTVEHQVPRSQGGSDELTNLVPACESCNSQKHAKTVEEFKAYLLKKQTIRFWGEHAVTTVLVASKEFEEEDEENRPASYHDHLASHLHDCLNVGRHYSPGFTSTILALLLQSLDNYYNDPRSGEVSGHWFFSIADVAAYTKQSVDAVFGHIMTMQSKDIIDVTWDQGPQGGHLYTFHLDNLSDLSHEFRDQDRAKGEISYLP